MSAWTVNRLKHATSVTLKSQYGAKPVRDKASTGKSQYGAQSVRGAASTGQSQYGAEPVRGSAITGHSQYGLRQEHGYKPLLLTGESSDDRGVDQAHNHGVASVPPISWFQSDEAPKEGIAMATCALRQC